MRIYAVADIHGKSEHMETIYKILDLYEPQLMVVPGDMTHFFNWSTVLSQLDSLPVPVLVVRGNTDLKRIEPRVKQAANIRLLTETPLQIEGFSFVGTSGTLSLPFANRVGLNEKNGLPPCPAPWSRTRFWWSIHRQRGRVTVCTKKSMPAAGIWPGLSKPHPRALCFAAISTKTLGLASCMKVLWLTAP